MSAWPVAHQRGPAGELHEKSAASVATGTHPGRLVSVMHPSGDALVLGSTQPADVADLDACRSAGVEVVRRRSGGGAVLVGRAEQLWVDVLVPRDDPLWRADVGQAAWWVGEAWALALARVAGLADLQVWRGALVQTEWSRLVCFAGRGAGEVVAAGDAKLVGISQRRTRAGALFQCSCLLRWDPGRLLALLDMEQTSRRRAEAQLAAVAAPVRCDPDALLHGFLASLP